MAISPLPQGISAWIQPDGTPTNIYLQYMLSLDKSSRVSVAAASPAFFTSPTLLTAALSADVALNNVSNFFDGPTINQGTVGTWWVSGGVQLTDTAAAAAMQAKLWDGTTIIDSGQSYVIAGGYVKMTLSGFIKNPVGNLRISARDISNTTGLIKFNQSGQSKDSTISAIRIA